jgi:hypothetical protein
LITRVIEALWTFAYAGEALAAMPQAASDLGTSPQIVDRLRAE